MYVSSQTVTAWFLFHYKSDVAVLSIYIRALFYFKIEKIKRKDKEIKNHLILGKMHRTGIELTTTGLIGPCSNHCVMEDFQYNDTLFPIYRLSIFMIIPTRANCVKEIGTPRLSGNSANTRGAPISVKAVFSEKALKQWERVSSLTSMSVSLNIRITYFLL